MCNILTFGNVSIWLTNEVIPCWHWSAFRKPTKYPKVLTSPPAGPGTQNKILGIIKDKKGMNSQIKNYIFNTTIDQILNVPNNFSETILILLFMDWFNIFQYILYWMHKNPLIIFLNLP